MQLIQYSHAAGRIFVDGLTRHAQKEAGQFMTPPAIARFMAERLVADYNLPTIRLLEPAAGAGILAAAVIEALLAKPQRPESIELMLCEQDERLLPVLNELVAQAKVACAAAGVALTALVQHGDFLLSPVALLGQPVDGLVVISNPPFFKLGKMDPRSQAHAYAVHGQPNIYGLFMAACARMVGPGGRYCFITPRSWMSGAYFIAARKCVMRHVAIECLHTFDSRSESFEEDSVLQELMITWGVGRPHADAGLNILLTRSAGASDLTTAAVHAMPIERIVSNDEHAMLSLPAAGANPFAGWTATLSTYGMQVSTGPVVAFRAAEYIRERKERGTVPLLWLQHVGQQSIKWPIDKKREHIKASASSASMLVRNQPMVVMRRFSPKEDQRRVTCAAYGCGTDRLPGDVIGLENHLNYIHRPAGQMTPDEARGLSAFLASKLVDNHFRALAGSTQVNATELRQLPLPPLAVLVAIGQALPPSPSIAAVDEAVALALANHEGQAAAA